MKKVLFSFLGVFAGLIFCAAGAFAQEDAAQTRGEILNGKAISLPAPEFPPAAKAVAATGTVVVQVTIDEEGNVIAAETVSGHPLLRRSSEKAALQAKFAPAKVNGKPAAIEGKLIYNFGTPQKSVINQTNSPQPEYPAAARAVDARGTVNVLVEINERGDVIEARAVSGHPLLRQASVKAARATKFAPVILNGEAVKITKVLVYKFPPADEATTKPGKNP